MENKYNAILSIMVVLAILTFVALHFIKAGYGMFNSKKWGVTISNKIGWVIMEAPVFIVMLILYSFSSRWQEPVIFTIFLFLSTITRAYAYSY